MKTYFQIGALVLTVLTAGGCYERPVQHEHEPGGTGPGFNAAPDSGGTPDAGVDAEPDAPPAPVDCDSYCELMALYCPGVFPTAGECGTACADYADTGERGDTRGDTLQCRHHYATLANALGLLACARANVDGGGFCGDPVEQVGTRENPIPIELGAEVPYINPDRGVGLWFALILDAAIPLGIETYPVDPETAIQGCAGDTAVSVFLAGNESADHDAHNGDRRAAPDLNRCSLLGPSRHPALDPAPAGTHLILAGTETGGDAAGPNVLRVWEVSPLAEGDPCLAAIARCGDGLRCDPSDGTCVENLCGDGYVAGDEACDDANEREGDGCEACRITPIVRGGACEVDNPQSRCADDDVCVDGVCTQNVCGDGYAGGEEACDDGNDDDSDGCTSRCSYEPFNGSSEPDSRTSPYELSFEGDRGAVVFVLERGDQDWFAFDLDTAGDVGMAAHGLGTDCDGNPGFILHDADGIELQRDADSGPGLCPLLIATLEPGRYLLLATSAGSTGGNWLRVQQLGEPPGLDDSCEADGLFYACPQGQYCADDETCKAHVCGDGPAPDHP